MDLSGATLAAQPIVAQARDILLRHSEQWLVALTFSGSALKGGFIPGCSDIDFELFLDDSTFYADGRLPVSLLLAIQRDLAALDVNPFSYIQCIPRSSKLPADWVGPIPGAYLLLAGRLPVPEATADDLRRSAQQKLAALSPIPAYLETQLMFSGPGRLARLLRIFSSDVWPPLYHLLVLREHAPIAVWNLTKAEAVELLPASTPEGTAIRHFQEKLWSFYQQGEMLEDGLEAIEQGVAFLHAARMWWSNIGAENS